MFRENTGLEHTLRFAHRIGGGKKKNVAKEERESPPVLLNFEQQTQGTKMQKQDLPMQVDKRPVGREGVRVD